MSCLPMISIFISVNLLSTMQTQSKRIKENGYQFFLETPTNQIFIILEDEILHALEGSAEFSFWENTMIRTQ